MLCSWCNARGFEFFISLSHLIPYEEEGEEEERKRARMRTTTRRRTRNKKKEGLGWA